MPQELDFNRTAYDLSFNMNLLYMILSKSLSTGLYFLSETLRLSFSSSSLLRFKETSGLIWKNLRGSKTLRLFRCRICSEIATLQQVAVACSLRAVIFNPVIWGTPRRTRANKMTKTKMLNTVKPIRKLRPTFSRSIWTPVTKGKYFSKSSWPQNTSK